MSMDVHDCGIIYFVLFIATVPNYTMLLCAGFPAR